MDAVELLTLGLNFFLKRRAQAQAWYHELEIQAVGSPYGGYPWFCRELLVSECLKVLLRLPIGGSLGSEWIEAGYQEDHRKSEGRGLNSLAGQ